MRFVRLLAAMAALAFSGQAQAAVRIDIQSFEWELNKPFHVAFEIAYVPTITTGELWRHLMPTEKLLACSNWLGRECRHMTLFSNPWTAPWSGQQVQLTSVSLSLYDPSTNGVVGFRPYFLSEAFGNPGVTGGSVIGTSARITSTIVPFSSSTMAVPEPATWAMMILGFGAIGGALRKRRRTARYVTSVPLCAKVTLP